MESFMGTAVPNQRRRVRSVSDPSGANAGSNLIDPLEHQRIAQVAYGHWEARGRPIGSPEEDWFRAEHELKRLEAEWC
jgi:Protein of unknown function (DUF2934)